MDQRRYEDYEPESLAAMLEENAMPNGKLIDQMMAALAKKNLERQQQDGVRDPVTGKIKSKPRRGTDVPRNKPQKRATGRGR